MRFVVDVMLGRLAKWLRLLGYDTVYTDIANLSSLQTYLYQGFIVITRRRNWPQHLGKEISYSSSVLILSSNDSFEQLSEVINKLSLRPLPERFCSRCIRCNSILEIKTKEEVIGKVPEYIWHTHQIFKQCPTCKRIYWSGTHPQRALEYLKRYLN